MLDLEAVIDEVIRRPSRASNRLAPVASYVIERFEHHGLTGLGGGSKSELRIPGLARRKDWDVAYDFAGKPRLLVSLKSIWKNAGGAVPNRIDDLMGEAANAQQLAPELVIGYVLLFDSQADSRRDEDNRLWSEFFEEAVRRIAIRKAPLWNQGLIEGAWFIRFDSKAVGTRVPNRTAVEVEGDSFIKALLAELRRREPAIPFTPGPSNASGGSPIP